jgi:hypothetical protein
MESHSNWDNLPCLGNPLYGYRNAEGNGVVFIAKVSRQHRNDRRLQIDQGVDQVLPPYFTRFRGPQMFDPFAG